MEEENNSLKPITQLENEDHEGVTLKVSYSVLSIVAGACLPVQATINASVADSLNSAFAASLWAFFTGTILLTLTFPFDINTKSLKNPLSFFSKENWITFKSLHPYLWLTPSFVGLMNVVLGTYLGPEIGFNLLFIAFVTGQLLASLLLDLFGAFGLPQSTPSKFRLVSVLLVLLGSILSVTNSLNAEEKKNSNLLTSVYFISTVIVGGLGMLQPPINAKLGNKFQTEPHRVAWSTFFIGSLWFIIILPISVKIESEKVNFRGLAELEWWQYLPGFVGLITVLSGIFLAHKLGLSLFAVLLIAGQLLMSLIIDFFGLMESEKVEIDAVRGIGVFLVFVGVLFFQFEKQIFNLVN
eukprot:snap_masked-scaffold_10-processed-gene-2.38-mRNA-1 protein AED:0.27 eAED:1.00 QI:0/-1/0/1/-1/1/1/0/353